MTKRWIGSLALAIALVMAGVGAAQAQDTSILNLEGTYDGLGPGGGNLESCGGGSEFSCGPGAFADIVADNEKLLGLPPGSIDPIGKFDEGIGTTGIDNAFSLDGGATSGFANAEGTVEVTTAAFALGEGLLFTIDVNGTLSDAWSIVKIIVKQADDPSGNFLAFGLGSVIAEPSTTLLKAFISAAQFEAAGFKGTLDLSHWHAFGVQGETTVPEPMTLMFLGLGIVGVGIAARKSRRS